MVTRGEMAEQLLARVWRMIQTNSLAHFTDEQPAENYDEAARGEFRKLYNEILDFDPGCVE
jgi:hypothetical protein